MCESSESERFITEHDLAELTGFSTRAFQAWRLAGKGPKAYRIANKGIRYKMSDVIKWLESKEINQEKEGL